MTIERPHSPPISRTDDRTWMQVIELFKQHGMAEPPVRLRDELVMALEWAWYGHALASSKPVAEEVKVAEPYRWIWEEDLINSGTWDDMYDDEPPSPHDRIRNVRPLYLHPLGVEAALSTPPQPEALQRRVEELEAALKLAEPYVEICHSLMTSKDTRALAWAALKQVRAAGGME